MVLDTLWFGGEWLGDIEFDLASEARFEIHDAAESLRIAKEMMR